MEVYPLATTEISAEQVITPKIESESNLEKAKRLFKNRNFAILIVTYWATGIFQPVLGYLNLYMHEEGLSYITIGILLSIYSAIALLAKWIGGHIADNYDRRLQSAISMFLAGIGPFIIAFARDDFVLALGYLSFTLVYFFSSGSTAFIMENVPKENSGFGMSMFSYRKVFNVIGLSFLGLLFAISVSFVASMQIALVLEGIVFFILGAIRLFGLKPLNKRLERKKFSLTSGFKIFFATMPVIMVIAFLDAVSDTMFQFVYLFYMRYELNISVSVINAAFILAAVLVGPLSTKLGKAMDISPSSKLLAKVYSLMPVSLGLLIVASRFTYILPNVLIDDIIHFFAPLDLIFQTGFIAIVLKFINDTLWYSLLFMSVKRYAPRLDSGKILSAYAILVQAPNILLNSVLGVVYTYIGGLLLILTCLAINIVILLILLSRKSLGKELPD